MTRTVRGQCDVAFIVQAPIARNRIALKVASRPDIDILSLLLVATVSRIIVMEAGAANIYGNPF